MWKIWDVASGAAVQSVRPGYHATWTSLVADGRGLITAGRSDNRDSEQLCLDLWSMESGASLRQIDLPQVTVLAVMPDGLSLATGQPEGITIWGLDGKRLNATMARD